MEKKKMREDKKKKTAFIDLHLKLKTNNKASFNNKYKYIILLLKIS